MSLDNLKMFPKNRVKALFGLDAEVLAEVIFRILPILEQNREQRLRTNPERKRRFVKNDGRPSEIKPIHKLLMTLLYLRQNTSAIKEKPKGGELSEAEKAANRLA